MKSTQKAKPAPVLADSQKIKALEGLNLRFDEYAPRRIESSAAVTLIEAWASMKSFRPKDGGGSDRTAGSGY
jgi:hypothetical protein